jgi:hypothetical protein
MMSLPEHPIENPAFPLLHSRLGSDHIENMLHVVCLVTVINNVSTVDCRPYSVHVTLLSYNIIICQCIPQNSFIFYAVHVISKESRQLVLPRTPCFIIRLPYVHSLLWLQNDYHLYLLRRFQLSFTTWSPFGLMFCWFSSVPPLHYYGAKP